MFAYDDANETVSTFVVEGLFLHTGYSLVEQYIINRHSPARFNTNNVQQKLTSLLNISHKQQQVTPHSQHASVLLPVTE